MCNPAQCNGGPETPMHSNFRKHPIAAGRENTAKTYPDKFTYLNYMQQKKCVENTNNSCTQIQKFTAFFNDLPLLTF